MLSKINSFGLNGINGYLVEVEVDINNGLPGFETVGLPDAAVKESKERVRSALKNSGFQFPNAKITINLAPADTKKEGPVYDLAIALGILCSSEQLNYKIPADTVFLGELSLNGDIRHINGILPVLISAREQNFKTVVVPFSNADEASYISGLTVYAIKDLKELAAFLKDKNSINAVEHKTIASANKNPNSYSDFKYVMGQYNAKRALEIAACGGHNILMIGPPGAGKTMLAKCLPTILPDMTDDEILETTKIHSIAGILDEKAGIVSTRPFRSPHHTTTRIALTGGGNKARPGEISLANNGVLFLDELPEYSRATLEILRQPLEDGVVSVSRVLRTVDYPARFMLIASMNPCPCGNYGSAEHTCKCSPLAIHNYMNRISGPLLDRIDLHVEVSNVDYDDLRSKNLAEPSEKIKERVNIAREIQTQRYKGKTITCNARMTPDMLNEYCALDKECEWILQNAFKTMHLSARAHSRILKVARTIADLEGAEKLNVAHISEAVNYRSLDRKYKV